MKKTKWIKLIGWTVAVLFLTPATLPYNPAFWASTARAQVPPVPEPCHAVVYAGYMLENQMVTIYFQAKDVIDIGEVCFTRIILWHVDKLASTWKPITTNNVAGITGPERFPWFQFPVSTNGDDFYGVTADAITNASSDFRLANAGPIRVRLPR